MSWLKLRETWAALLLTRTPGREDKDCKGEIKDDRKQRNYIRGQECEQIKAEQSVLEGE